MTDHTPVLLLESIDALVTNTDGNYVDCTFGRGGHAKEILNRLSGQGHLLVIDKDPEAIDCARREYGADDRVSIAHGSFGDIATHVVEAGLGLVSGVILDLGMSSPQLEESARGFSFQRHGPLDMRMNNEVGVTAAQWLSKAKESDIARVLRVYGEERFARRIARKVVATRTEKVLESTSDLVELIELAIPFREKNKHPATRTFQAIRIFINRELDDLKAGLSESVELLAGKGRLVVISFHSLEDRMVKRFFRDEERGQEVPSRLPIPEDQIKKRLKRVGRVTRPTEAEQMVNVRSRSAIMRVAERIQA